MVAAAATDIFPDDPPRFLARTPHGYHDKQAIVADVRSAGFVNVAVETLTRRSIAPSCRDPAIGFCQGTPLRTEIEARDANKLTETTDAAAAKISARFGNGPVDGMIQAHVITASYAESESEHLVPETFPIMPAASLRSCASDGPFECTSKAAWSW